MMPRVLTLVMLVTPLTTAPAAAQQPAPTKEVLPTDRTVLPIHEPVVKPITTLDARDAKAPPRFEVKAPKGSWKARIVSVRSS